MNDKTETYKPFISRLIQLFSFLGLFISMHVQGQIPEHEKYPELKKRLHRDFVKIGPGPGESIPAGRFYQRWDNEHRRYYYTLEFGDATIHLGWYLAVLATENHLLRQHGKSTKNNLRELYYALHALDRLDRVSDIAWSNFDGVNKQHALFDTTHKKWIPRSEVKMQADGFFIRDDVPPYFFTHFKRSEISSSDFSRHTNPVSFRTDNLGGEESKDQLISILTGLFFVHRFVGEDDEFDGINLKQYNKELCKRIVDFVRYEKNNKLGSWKISNPGKDFGLPHLGYDPVLFSYPIAVIADEIVYGKKYNKTSFLQPINEKLKPGYHDINTKLTKQIFIRIRDAKVIHDKNYDWHINYYMIYMLAATSNVWAHDLAYSKNAVDILKERCSDEESKGWLIYPLMNYVLYPGNELPYDKQYVEKELALYPVSGSFNFFSTHGENKGKYTPHWFSSNRFQSSDGTYEGNAEVDCNSYFNGEFNGLDYMLLYNLYRIAYAKELKDVPYSD